MPDRFANGSTENDAGGRSGDRLVTGFDPTDKGFYHGGDLKGLTDKLDYVQALGATAIWLTPVFTNQPVQRSSTGFSAGYHGYWGTDFTNIDPHLGTRDDYRELVNAAHARGMKVYFDVVVNHTADVIKYADCPSNCAYRSKADFPYVRRGGLNASSTNSVFQGDDSSNQTNENFRYLTDEQAQASD